MAVTATSRGGQKPYLYLAASADGKRRLGIRRASDARHLAEQLRRERMVPLKRWSVPGLAGGAVRISLKDQAELNAQLNQLLSRGVPLVEALEVAASAVSAPVRPKVERMRELVAAGTSFAEACRSVGGFDLVTVAVYRAAERTGDLAGAAKQLSATMRRQLAISGKAVTLLIYPAIVLSISVLVSLLMLTMVVPNIGKSLKGANVPLPGYTQVMIGAGEFIRENVVWCLLGVLVAATAAVFARARIGAALDRVVRRLPLVREVLVAQESARLFTVLSAMTRSGVPLADGLGTAVGAVRDPHLKKELTRLRTRLIEGGVLRVLIDEVRTLPVATRRLLIAGERAGDLESVFDTLSTDMADEVERRSSRLLAAMEPALIVMMFVMIGSLLLSILIPLITATNRMNV